MFSYCFICVMIWCICGVIAIKQTPCSPDTITKVERLGKICGLITESVPEVKVYKGIPYAIPPIGDLRYHKTELLMDLEAYLNDEDDGVFPAVEFGAYCPQYWGDKIIGDEDCLSLNLFVPNTKTRKLAVMIYIHGGSFLSGSGALPLFDGTNLAKENEVIVVTINYRLGNLGYLAIPVTDIDGNFGVHDQQLAMRWVHKYISSFNGDPKQVTIFGESAGAMSVGLHLFSIPSSQTLFRAAIMQSNPIALPYPTSSNQLNLRWKTFETSLCNVMITSASVFDCTISVDELRNFSTETLMKADLIYLSKSLLNEGWFAFLDWTPILDDLFIIGQPFDGYSKGMIAKPFIFGFNKNESIVFTVPFQSDVNDNVPVFIQPLLYSVLLAVLFGKDNAASIVEYDRYSPINAPQLATFGNNIVLAALSNLIEDFMFRCGLLQTVEQILRVQEEQPIYGYVFVQDPNPGYRLPNPDGDGLKECEYPFNNVCHTAELPYVFNTLESTFVEAINVTESDQRLANQIGRLWGTFAKTLDLQSHGWAPVLLSSPSLRTDESLFQFGDGILDGDVYSDSNCAFWKTQFPFGSSS